MICSVCGAMAQGINFGAPSCMSCKTFFRRNALRAKPLKCAFTNCCRIDMVTRKFCARCRFDRCLSAGMKPNLIQANNKNRRTPLKFRLKYEEMKKYAKDEVNQDQDKDFIEQTLQLMSQAEVEELRRIHSDLSDHLNNSSSEEGILSEILLEHFSTSKNEESEKGDYLLQCLLLSDNELDQQQQQFNDPLMEVILEDQNIQLKPNLINSSSSSLMLHHVQMTSTTLVLDPMEAAALRELHSACERHLRSPATYPVIRHLRTTHHYFATVREHREHCSNGVRVPEEEALSWFSFARLVRMSHQVGGGVAGIELTNHHRARLLRRNLYYMMVAQAMLGYNRDHQCWSLVDDKNSVTVLVPFPHLPRKYGYDQEEYAQICESHRNLLASLRTEWRQDPMIFDLLTVILMFSENPTPPPLGGAKIGDISNNNETPNETQNENENPISSTEFEHFHQLYLRLLHRYLRLKYPQPEQAEECFSGVMQFCTELRRCSDPFQWVFEARLRWLVSNIASIVAPPNDDANDI